MFSAQGFAGRGGGAAPNAGSNFGGGGSNFGGATSSSPSGQGGAKRQTQPIRPLSIKQLLNAQRVGDGVMVIDGREATQVTVLGRIIDHEGNTSSAGGMTAKHHGYKISDGTGIVVVRQWLDADRDQEILPVGHYVRASGSVKIWQDKPVITGTVRNASDANELTFHLLDAVLTHLRITRGPVPQTAAPAAAPSAMSSYGSIGGAPGGTSEKLFPNDVVTAILKNHAKTQGGSAGMTQEEVAVQAQRHGTSIMEVRTAMKSLLSEGKIYNVDNTHFSA
jgi:replication factor A2